MKRRKQTVTTWNTGEDNPQAKLTWEDVLTIRILRDSGEKLRWLAARFGVSVFTIHRVVHNRLWQV